MRLDVLPAGARGFMSDEGRQAEICAHVASGGRCVEALKSWKDVVEEDGKGGDSIAPLSPPVASASPMSSSCLHGAQSQEKTARRVRGKDSREGKDREGKERGRGRGRSRSRSRGNSRGRRRKGRSFLQQEQQQRIGEEGRRPDGIVEDMSEVVDQSIDLGKRSTLKFRVKLCPPHLPSYQPSRRRCSYPSTSSYILPFLLLLLL
eukprot:762574-Hanusia_phi.AAC.1